MLGVDLSVAEMNEQDLLNHFRQYSLNRLKSFYDGYNSCISVLIGLGKTETSDSQDPLYSRYETRLKTVEQAMEERKADIENVNRRIQTLESEQKEFLYGSSAMAQPLFSYQPHDLKTCLGSLYAEFCKYRREDAYTNNSYTSEGLDTAECLEKAKELLDAAHREAKKACRLQRTASASLHNLFALPEFEPLYDKFALYNYIRIRTEDEVLKLRIAGIEFHGETAHEVQVTFAEHVDVVSSTAQTVRQTLQQAAQMSESYPSTVLQAEKGNQAEQKLQEIETNGLDAGKNMVTNSENNEITITRSGIIGKCMNDEGSYGDRQFRITGNTMAFTDDNWKSVRVAIGENTFRHPLTESKETQYGIFAENIIGNLIAGNKLYIGTKDKSVCITENGIKIDKGTISWNGVNPPGMGDISGLSEFKRKVNAALTGSPTTEIGSDYVISPKIGGGYLYIKDQRNVPNNAGVGVEINPNGTVFNVNTEEKEFIFNISKHDKRDLVMGVDKHGDGFFKGEIDATSISAKECYKIYYGNHTVDLITAKYAPLSYRWFIDISFNQNMGTGIFYREDEEFDFLTGNRIPKIRINSYQITFECKEVYLNKANIHSETGQITTSDHNLKSDIKPLTEKHMKFFSLLQPVSFRFKDGKSGRTHIGFISQDVENAMKQARLTDLDFAGFCKDVKIIETEDEYGNTTSQIEKDENGHDVYIYSLRYDEFIALNTFMIQNLYKENQDIKERLLRLEEKIDNLENS